MSKYIPTQVSDSEVVSFKAISNFVNALFDFYDSKIKEVVLYHHLITKTTLSHTDAIQKHVNGFTIFCVTNREGILKKDYTLFTEHIVRYSDKVFLNITDILELLNDKDTESIFWKHLLTLSALLDPAGEARKVLKDAKKQKGTENEANFLTDIIDKIENNIDPSGNPMDAIGSIMQSGIFTDLIAGMGSGIDNGTLDMSSLMGTVQTMISGMNKQSDAGGSVGNDNPFDIGSLMKTMGNLTAPPIGGVSPPPTPQPTTPPTLPPQPTTPPTSPQTLPPIPIPTTPPTPLPTSTLEKTD